MSTKRECFFPEVNACERIPSDHGKGNGIENGRDLCDPKDENMNEWIHSSVFSIQSAPLSDSCLESLSRNGNGRLSSKLSLPISAKNEEEMPLDVKSDILPLECGISKENTFSDGDDLKREYLEKEDTIESLVRPCSLMIPANSNGKGFNLTAVANEAQLRQCPILVKDLSCDTADDDDNENHLTISSLTARPLIAKSHELRTKKVARKLREAERRARIRRFKPPDGGYGWAIVVGAFLVQFWVSGLVKSYGVLFVEVMETFTDTSAAVAAWIPAILSTLCLALGELLRRLVNFLKSYTNFISINRSKMHYYPSFFLVFCHPFL